MKRPLSVFIALALVGVACVACVAQPAAAADVTLYEVTENMQLLFRPHWGTSRVASSTLTGRAAVGSPLCPAALVAAYNPGATSCAVNVNGSDNIDVRTGQGTFGGTLTVVVQGDNAADSPELVVMSGSFQGKMDFAPALVNGVPYGSVVGTLKLSKKQKDAMPFTGVFRLPFAGNYAGADTGGVTLRQIFCPLTPVANPYAMLYDGWDLAYISTSDGQPNGRCLDIYPSEMSLGAPLVRFELTFAN